MTPERSIVVQLLRDNAQSLAERVGTLLKCHVEHDYQEHESHVSFYVRDQSARQVVVDVWVDPYVNTQLVVAGDTYSTVHLVEPDWDARLATLMVGALLKRLRGKRSP